MSQTATFYPISENELQRIAINSNEINGILPGKIYATISGTHMGIQFILQELNPENSGLIEEIFNPPILNYDKAAYPDEDQDYPEDPVYFHSTLKVKMISQLLESVSEADMMNRYDPDELNKAKIYPWYWYYEKDNENKTNEKHIVNDFRILKDIFRQSGKNNNCLLCFIG